MPWTGHGADSHHTAPSDDTIGVFNFNPEELEGIAPHSVQEQYPAKFGFKPPPIPKGYSRVSAPVQNSSQAPQNDFSNSSGKEKIDALVAKKSNKNK